MCIDTHIIMMPTPGGPVPTPLPNPFSGIINGSLSTNVKIMGQPAATLGSTAQNTLPHVPIGPGTFQIPPQNRATITQGSTSVMINGKPAARNGDPALTCDDVVPMPHGTVMAVGTVLIG